MQHFDKQAGFFLLLQRGGCSFTEKVKNAHDFGAEIVLVSDYKDEKQAGMDSKFDLKLDGLLQQHIPAFEIEWADARKMVDFIHTGE